MNFFKNVLLLSIFIFSLLFIFTIKTYAYTGTETVNITTSNTWADNYNFTFSDGQIFSQSVFNNQLSYIKNQIVLDKTTLGATYYIVNEIQSVNTNNLLYSVYYYGSSPDLANKTSTDSYMFENSTFNGLRLVLTSTILGSRTFTFPNSNISNATMSSLSTSTSGGINYVIYLVAKDRLNVIMPHTYFADTDIPASTLSNFKMTLTNYGGYPNIKINGVSLTKGQTYKITDYFDFITFDSIAPVITLNGNSTVYIDERDTYSDLGAMAIDNVDGNLTSSIITTSNVDPNVAGTYSVTYSVTDSAGNVGQATRTVIVNDKYKRLYLYDQDRDISSVAFYLLDQHKAYVNLNSCDTCKLNQSFYFNGSFTYYDTLDASKIPTLNESDQGMKNISNVTYSVILGTPSIGSDLVSLAIPYRIDVSQFWVFNKFYFTGTNSDIMKDFYIEYNSYDLGYVLYNKDNKVIETDQTSINGTNNYTYTDKDNNPKTIDGSSLSLSMNDYLGSSSKILLFMTNSISYFLLPISMIFGYIGILFLALPFTFQMFLIAMLSCGFVVVVIKVLF